MKVRFCADIYGDSYVVTHHNTCIAVGCASSQLINETTLGNVSVWFYVRRSENQSCFWVVFKGVLISRANWLHLERKVAWATLDQRQKIVLLLARIKVASPHGWIEEYRQRDNGTDEEEYCGKKITSIKISFHAKWIVEMTMIDDDSSNTPV